MTDKTLTAGELAGRLRHIIDGNSLEDFDELCNEHANLIIAALESKSAVGGTEIETKVREIARYSFGPNDGPRAVLTAAADELRRLREALSALRSAAGKLPADLKRCPEMVGCLIEADEALGITLKDPQP